MTRLPVRARPLKRARLARDLGRTGLLLAAVFTAVTWAALAFTFAPARALLDRADTQLTALDARLADAQTALAPFDVLARPETLEAVQGLGDLARRAQAAPLLDLVIPPDTLEGAVTLTREWETALNARPPLPALQAARADVQGWQARVQTLRVRLTGIALLTGALLTLLCAWFAAGQWALWRWAEDQLNPSS